MAKTRRRLVLLALCLLGGAAGTALAHPFSQSSSVLVVSGREVRARLTLDLLDFHQLPDIDRNRDNRISPAELDDAIERLYTAVAQHYSVRSAGDPLETTVERYGLADETRVRLDILYRFAGEVTTVDVTSTLGLITQPNHLHLISVRSGPIAHEAVLEVSRPRLSFATGPSSTLVTFGYFLRLGVSHIFTGYGPLALFLGLLIVTTMYWFVQRVFPR